MEKDSKFFKDVTDYKIYETLDYDRFKFLPGNREIIPNHLSRLKKSISSNYYVSPILVNERYEVIDGQHRLSACKQLGLPVLYLITKGYSTGEIKVLNRFAKNWSPDDYLDSYYKLKNPEYVKFKEFKDTYGFATRESLWLLTGLRSNLLLLNEFKEGNFKVKCYDQAVCYAERLIQFETYYKGFRRRAFVNACLRMFNHPDYNHDTMLDKLTYQSVKLVDCSKASEYLKILQEIYNYHSKSSNRILFVS